MQKATGNYRAHKCSQTPPDKATNNIGSLHVFQNPHTSKRKESSLRPPNRNNTLFLNFRKSVKLRSFFSGIAYYSLNRLASFINYLLSISYLVHNMRCTLQLIFRKILGILHVANLMMLLLYDYVVKFIFSYMLTSLQIV